MFMRIICTSLVFAYFFSLTAKPIIIENPEQLKELFACESCRPFYAHKNDVAEPIPELMLHQGIMLFEYNIREDFTIFDVHYHIINAVKPPYKVVIFTTSPRYYMDPHWEDRENIFIVDTTRCFPGAVYTSWGRDFFPETIITQAGKRWQKFHYFTEKPDDFSWIKKLASQLSIPYSESPLLLEGGNLEVDDEHNLYVSRGAILKNPQEGEFYIQKQLQDNLKVKTVTFLPLLPGDMTGHVDMYMKIIGHHKVLVADSLESMRHEVLESVDAIFRAQGFEVVRIMNADLAENHPSDFQEVLTLTYTNSVILGNTVFMPVYSSPKGYLAKHCLTAFDDNFLQKSDAEAQKIYESQGFFVVPIPSAEVIFRNGTVHCLTKQIY